MFVEQGIANTGFDGASQLLLDAADAIERYGWATGSFGSKEFGFCVRGALRFAIRNVGANPFGSDSYCEAERRLVHHLSQITPDIVICVPSDIERWNDTGGATSKEHVIATLRAVALQPAATDAPPPAAPVRSFNLSAPIVVTFTTAKPGAFFTCGPVKVLESEPAF